MKDLEKEFDRVRKAAMIEIKKHLSDASDALYKAVKISEQYGVPFDSGISFLGQTYTPTTFRNKWPDLDSHVLENYGLWDEDDFEYAGWQHSAVC